MEADPKDRSDGGSKNKSALSSYIVSIIRPRPETTSMQARP